ncbi:MAG: hypothetical protein ACRDH9_04380 [Actinomycetota bacterium]
MRHRVGGAVLLVAVFLASCAGDTAGTSGPPETEPVSQPSISEPSPTAAATTPEQVPEPATTEQGGSFWGVYLAAGEGPELEDAIRYLTEEGGLGLDEFNAGSDIHCDGGARKALGPVGPLVVAVYFLTLQDAEAWAATLPAPPLGIAEVRTFCLD